MMTAEVRYSNIAGLYAVVTGGSSGIGFAISSMLLEMGANVSILDINPETTTAAVQSLKDINSSYNITSEVCDVSDYGSLLLAFESCYSKHRRIDIVIANAGINTEHQPGQNFLASPSSLSAQSPPPLQTLDVNLLGCLYTIYAGIYYIRKGGRGGTVLCTASNAGIYPFSVGPIYAASKHAIVGLVRSAAPTLKEDDITINALAPSAIRTNLAVSEVFDAMIETPMSILLSAVKELIANRSLTGKIAELGPEGENGCLFVEAPEYRNETTRYNYEQFSKLGRA